MSDDPIPARGLAGPGAIYSLIYVAVVAADQASTGLIESQGGSEGNPFFQAMDGSLSTFRAVGVFVILLPVMLGLLEISRRRAVGRSLAQTGWASAVIGRTATSAALLPMTLVVAKALAALTNLADAFTPLASLSRIRNMLKVVGVLDGTVAFFLFGLLILWLSIIVGRPLASAWTAHFANQGEAALRHYPDR